MSYQDGLDVLGFGWQDALQAVHGVGKGVLSMFGAGAAGEALEDVYRGQGWLPSKPKTGAPQAGAQQEATREAQLRAQMAMAAMQSQYQQAFFAEQQRLAAIAEAKKREDRKRFVGRLVVGVSLAGVGVLAWWALGPKRHSSSTSTAAPAPAPAAGGTP